VIEFVSTGDELSVSNCVERVNARVRPGLGSDGETEFIASHLSELTVAAIRVIDIAITSEIVRLELLRVSNEDWLLHGELISFSRLLHWRIG
jgi:hypothetical protein